MYTPNTYPMYSYEEFTDELETLLQKYFGVEWKYWYDDRLTIVSETLARAYECREDGKYCGECNESEEN
tara:strand:- start:712 stop:918 length:207 start_codon:yes stop_codon:yes gene_type:complete